MTVAIRPQPGPQTRAMACPADILVYGGEAGAGKTFFLTYEPIRHIRNPRYNAVLFRRLRPEITNPGGPWDESRTLYGPTGAKSLDSILKWVFPSGAVVQMAGLQYDKDVEEWTGSQIATLLFDQLESFTEHQFFYMLSRNRTRCGVRPYVRATCNPQPGWLAEFLAWWIDDEGWPIPDRDGVLRWMIRLDEKIIWGDSWRELYEQYPDQVLCPGTDPLDYPHKAIPKSVTFIAGSVYDNKVLLRSNPEYLSNLMALPRIERLRLLGREGTRGGNWKVRPLVGMMFGTEDFQIVDEAPPLTEFTAVVRYWDKAGTEHKDEQSAKRAHTAGVLIGRTGQPAQKNVRYYVLDVVRGQWKAGAREEVILQTARLDAAMFGSKGRVVIAHEQEPGSGGKESAEATTSHLTGHGFTVVADKVSGSKVERAVPWSASVQNRKVYVLNRRWTRQYVDEHVGFTPTSLVKDQVDASAGAHNKLSAEQAWTIHRSAY